MLNYITTGESHGRYMAVILEGMPSGLGIDMDYINGELRRRQGGFGRGGRQKIEADYVEIMGGVIRKKTTGAPIGLLLKNKDHTVDVLPSIERPRRVTRILRDPSNTIRTFARFWNVQARGNRDAGCRGSGL